MSIQSEITRIQNGRDASFTAVENKGVTVPAGSTIDDLPDLIALINQGSGTIIEDALGYYLDQNNGYIVVVGGSTVMTEETVSTDGAVTKALDVNTICHFTGDLTSLTITLTPTTNLAQYHFDFISGSTAPTLTMPNTVTMPDGFSVSANRHYEISILNNLASVDSWAIPEEEEES